MKRAENFRVHELVKKIESHPQVQCSECFLIGIKDLSFALDWMLSQSRTTSSIRSDLVVLGTEKLRRRKSISKPTMLSKEMSETEIFQ